MTKEETFTLSNLKGRSGLTRAVYVRSISAAVRAVREGKTATAAGSHGAINIWRESKGGTARLHAAFYRHRAEISHVEGLTLVELRAWLRRWFPQLKG